MSVREKEGLSIRETAKRFHIGSASLSRWLKNIELKPPTSRQRKIDKSAVEKYVEHYPEADQRACRTLRRLSDGQLPGP